MLDAYFIVVLKVLNGGKKSSHARYQALNTYSNIEIQCCSPSKDFFFTAVSVIAFYPQPLK